MDGGHKSNRKYPAYTTSQLEATVAKMAAGLERDSIEAEIKARKDGRSVVFVTPQVGRS